MGRDFDQMNTALNVGQIKNINTKWNEVVLQMNKVQTLCGTRTSEQNWNAYKLLQRCKVFSTPGPVKFKPEGNIGAIATFLEGYPVAQRDG